MSETAASDEIDDRDSVELAILDALAELSDVDPVPSEVDAGSPFDASEIPFDGVEWLPYVARVQDWLRLDPRLDPEASPAESVARLFDALGAKSVADAVVIDHVAIAVTQQGLNLLRDRVERAVNLKDRFLEAVEAGSVEAATRVWIDEWDDTVDSTISGPIMARADVWSINDFAGKAKYGRLQLSPSYQRGDVWPTKDAQLLIESILRGIPLPSVIVLRPAKDADVPFEVVDGKQRLTSILRFIGGHPDALDRIRTTSAQFPAQNLEALFASDYKKFRHAWKNATGETLTSMIEKEYYFPFKLSSVPNSLSDELAPLAGKYYTEIREMRVRVGGTAVDIRELFESATDYKIPVIEYTEAKPQQIHEVFNLYNKQGKHLNAEEIRNAVYHDVSLMRALSVAAGDNPNLESAAPFLAPVVGDVEIIRENLRDFGIGDVRYRRSKVLGWLFSVLFVPQVPTGVKPSLLSTSRQINALLDHVQNTQADPLRDEVKIQQAIQLVSGAMEAHAGSNAWHETFRNANGAKWQDLQLIASLVGFAMAGAVLGEDLQSRVSQHADDLRRRSQDEWKRPRKTQTGSQWKYIGTVALAIVDELEVEPSDVEKLLMSQFGSSCVATLQAARILAD